MRVAVASCFFFLLSLKTPGLVPSAILVSPSLPPPLHNMEDNPAISSGAADDAQAVAAGQDAPGDVVGAPSHASGRFDKPFAFPLCL